MLHTLCYVSPYLSIPVSDILVFFHVSAIFPVACFLFRWYNKVCECDRSSVYHKNKKYVSEAESK